MDFEQKKKNHLKARIIARNRAGKRGNEIYAELIEIFRPLVGTKILKVDGGFLQKVAKLLPEFPYSRGLQIYRHSSDYSLAWCSKACEQIEGAECCTYEEVTVYIGSLKGTTLESLQDAPDFREDFQAAHVEHLRKVYDDAKKAADDARSALFPFGENDR
tara:strand:- start:1741 stop:2220 length:480 start_codon:yes stop_codon:yes gene_type:complete